MPHQHPHVTVGVQVECGVVAEVRTDGSPRNVRIETPSGDWFMVPETAIDEHGNISDFETPVTKLHLGWIVEHDGRVHTVEDSDHGGYSGRDWAALLRDDHDNITAVPLYGNGAGDKLIRVLNVTETGYHVGVVASAQAWGKGYITSAYRASSTTPSVAEYIAMEEHCATLTVQQMAAALHAPDKPVWQGYA